jgi:hypothetical protein
MMTEFHRHELMLDEPPEERAWYKFCAGVAVVLSLSSLDGDQDEDGYSLDTAYDYFKDGHTVAEYVAFVKEERRGN